MVDYDPVKARRIKEQFGFKESYEDISEMLKKSDVDAVDICTPNYLHAPMAIAALRSGRDVLCEKPLARTAKEAQQMVDTAEKHDRILMAAMNNRFREDAQMLQKFVSAKELGGRQHRQGGLAPPRDRLEGPRVVHRARQGRWRRAARTWARRSSTSPCGSAGSRSRPASPAACSARRAATASRTRLRDGPLRGRALASCWR